MIINWQREARNGFDRGIPDSRIVVAADWAPLWQYEGVTLRDPQAVSEA